MDERTQGNVGHAAMPADPADEDEPGAGAGDVANLMEVRGWLRDSRPAMTVEQFRERRRSASLHRRATA